MTVNYIVAVISCGHVKTPSNGAKNGSSPLLGTVVTFSCNDGFRLEGLSAADLHGTGQMERN